MTVDETPSRSVTVMIKLCKVFNLIKRFKMLRILLWFFGLSILIDAVVISILIILVGDATL